jgi:hypothetical protein
MPPLLHFDPTGAMFSPITPEQFDQLMRTLRSDAKVSGLLVTAAKLGQAACGSCEIQGVDFAWTYDGASNLHVSITAKHGIFVSHVPNATIFDRLNEQFSQHLAS